MSPLAKHLDARICGICFLAKNNPHKVRLHHYSPMEGAQGRNFVDMRKKHKYNEPANKMTYEPDHIYVMIYKDMPTAKEKQDRFPEQIKRAQQVSSRKRRKKEKFKSVSNLSPQQRMYDAVSFLPYPSITNPDYLIYLKK